MVFSLVTSNSITKTTFHALIETLQTIAQSAIKDFTTSGLSKSENTTDRK